MKTCVVIPAYNEAKEIGRIVSGVRSQGIPVIVVDDGSMDATSRIAREEGAQVLRNETNVGKGSSLSRGFAHALAQGYDAVVIMDGDGQHDPLDIPSFLRAQELTGCEIIIGNRMQEAQTMPRLRYLTNRFMSWLISCIIGQKIPDTQCGFRLIKKEVLNRLSLRTRKFEIESEMIINAARIGFRIGSIPIKTLYRDEKSQINPFIDTLRFIRFIFCSAFLRREV
ncbi:MAG: glycosyltransferase family 2 protein [Candidatus Omnitrophica bacterium]|nr:glycosyltransferase family 2 protein [Candidatus Omnitrophota bacterium]